MVDDVDRRLTKTASYEQPLFRALDGLIARVPAAFPLLALCTPIDAEKERVRLLHAWMRGDEIGPRREAPMVQRAALANARRAIEAARIEVVASSSPTRSDADVRLRHAYAERLEEIDRELAIVDVAFKPAINRAARQRYLSTEPDDAATQRAADALATAWLAPSDAENTASPDVESHRTDDANDSDSLLTQMRRAIAAYSVGVRVIVRERVGALAASGDGVVIVAADRRTSARQAARVVLHEVEGHVMPRERARGARPALACLGTAGAGEDEEGRALVLEDCADHLDDARRKQLARRHFAARWTDEGATFVDVVRRLADTGSVIDESIRIAMRVQRGGFGEGATAAGGLARERVYLPAYLRVRSAIEAGQTTLAQLGSARLSLRAWRGGGLDVRAASV